MKDRHAPSSLREALREATADVHRRLEKRLPLTANALTRSGYRELLEAFFGFYRPLEASLEADAMQIPGLEWPLRRKAGLLAQDLQDLGLGTAAIADVPNCPSLPQLNHRATTLGCLYVLEGSTLGGQITGRAIHARWGFGPSHGARFLLPYGRDTGRMWRNFLAILGETDDQPEPFRTRACATAVETFLALENWLEKREVLH